MKFTVLTLFPEIVDAFFGSSIMAKAISRGVIGYQGINIRDYALDKHHKCDDAPYGGGAGMLMLPDPLSRCLEAVGAIARDGLSVMPSAVEAEAAVLDAKHAPSAEAGPEPAAISASAAISAPVAGASVVPQKKPRVIYLSPSGRPFTQALAREFSEERELILLCGRYEGVDQRVIDRYVDDEVSIGDYVLSSGEVAALAVVDAVYRLVDGVITAESLDEESYADGLLEYPQYTRPEVYAMLRVPEVLLSGHHEQIRRWRLRKRVEKTLRVRPDLIRRGLEAGTFDAETIELIQELVQGEGHERD